jgi:multidrug efflux system outer membrane protein
MALTGALAAALAGCSLAPDYHVPALATPSVYKELPAGWQQARPAAAALPQAWWTAFADTVLDDLETRIEASNPSLAVAVARYDQARGQLGVARADLFPEIGVNGSAQRARVSGNRPIAVNGATTYDNYVVGSSLAYELDVFGRVRNAVRAGRADTQASAADVAGVRLGLQARLADAYFQLRGLDRRLALLDETVKAFQRAYDLTDARHRGGIASGLDTNRARAQLSAARAEIAATRSQRASYEHAIATLVGAPASSLTIAVAPLKVEPLDVPAGTPAALLQRRPDIDAAERRVAAANARIGVARAALFPSITLGASGGFQTTGPDLLSTASSFWALGPAQAVLTLIDGGARRARVRVARGEFAEAAAQYKETVLTAFQEVEDDLAAARELARQEADLADAAQAAARTRDLALVRYRDGASDYLEVVTAQTAALDAERALIDVRTFRLTTAVDTVRALGGPAG